MNTRFKVGDIVKGSVSKIASFGAFVELEDDIDGLVHISQISEERIEKVKDKLNVGDQVEARVIKVDKVERRIGLSIKALAYSDADIQKESAAFEALKPSPPRRPGAGLQVRHRRMASRRLVGAAHHILNPEGDAAAATFLERR